MRVPETKDLAWVAGIFEGEGSLLARRDKREKNPNKRVTVQVSMTDEDIICRLHALMDAGTLQLGYRPPTFKPHYKSRNIWALYKDEEARAFLYMIYPWMGERRRAMIEDAVN